MFLCTVIQILKSTRYIYEPTYELETDCRLDLLDIVTLLHRRFLDSPLFGLVSRCCRYGHFSRDVDGQNALCNFCFFIGKKIC